MVRAVAQRVSCAAVRVEGAVIGEIERGFAILVGIGRGDTEADVYRVADKLAVLRVFEDTEGKMNLSASDVGGAMLVVSQFTLYADTRKGRRPSFVDAAPPEEGARLVGAFVARLTEHGYHVETGKFGAEMQVSIENDGPVTIILDSKDL